MLTNTPGGRRRVWGLPDQQSDRDRGTAAPQKPPLQLPWNLVAPLPSSRSTEMPHSTCSNHW